MRRIRIVSNGTSPGTRVEDADTGEDIEGVVNVEWSCAVDEVARAVVTFDAVLADVVGEVDE